jgi:hypothetical protein
VIWLLAAALAADPKDDAITLTPFTGAEIFVGQGANRLVVAGSVLPSVKAAAGLRFDLGLSTPLDPNTRATTFQQGTSGTLGGFQAEAFLGYDSRGSYLATATVDAGPACELLDEVVCTPEKLRVRLAALREALTAGQTPCADAGLPETCDGGAILSRIGEVERLLAATVKDPVVFWSIGADVATTYNRVEAYPFFDKTAPVASAPAGSVLDPDASPVGWDDYDVQGGGHLALVFKQVFSVDVRGGAALTRDITVDEVSFCPERDAGDARSQEGCADRTWLTTEPEEVVEGYVRFGLTGILPTVFGGMDAVPGLEARFNLEGLGAKADPTLTFRGTAFLMPIRKAMQVSVGAGVQVDVALSDTATAGSGEVTALVPFGFVGGTLGRSDPLTKGSR